MYSKVEQFYNKNQFIIRSDNTITFQSYNSTVAILKNGVLTLGSDWDYSRTTLKHLYKFFNDCVYVIKELEELDQKSNKKAYIQQLIDKGVILYDNNL